MDTHTQTRIDTYLDRAERARQRAEAAFNSSDRHSARFEGGQPLLVGHSSYKSARRAQERSHSAMSRGMEALRAEKYWQGKADTARRRYEQAHDPGVIQRRITRKEVELRDLERRQEQATNPEHIEHLRERANEIRAVIDDSRKELEDSGARVWTRQDFHRGDFALCGNVLWEIQRVNAKSVTVGSISGSPVRGVYRLEDNPYNWTDTIRYEKITGRMTADEMAARGR